MTDVLRFSAFPAPSARNGGNPAGVVLDAAGLDETAMLALAAETGYSETAFVLDIREPAEADGPRRVSIRYFSPDAEVPFCGHATVATAVALADRHGTGRLLFDTAVGEVAIETAETASGEITASFTSVEPSVTPMGDDIVDRLLSLLGLGRADLDSTCPPRLSFAGNVHPVIVLGSRDIFDSFDFDPSRMRELMDERGWAATVTVLYPLDGSEFAARNLFPVGDITEDPATGAAAAATGAYLRAVGAVKPPARFRIRQGDHVGRPSLLRVTVPDTGGIVVTGGAARID
ncbi:phenazine biosynthesis protein PhzF family [Actinopolyspora mzabensis]|uniref:Phenazine biosynthesis protein PhzF family n=1 Tax=Actinopolyspora mzabensis TaxID=995066 RepID=A0A1G9CAI6_ACTMZ|nr:PhzF family phenazine biosynthesis isomerase [Actinopolyspora mzabensis]SDK48669.1 phenazine biosynthesis protein PhzF family [Actinopolyspora mzabensis]